MIAYILREPLAPNEDRGAIVSTGPDDLSCQAEVLAYFRREQTHPEFPKGQIFAHYVIDTGFTKASWLDAIPQNMKDSALEAKIQIELQGFDAFHKGEIDLDLEPRTGEKMVRIIGRPSIIDQFRLRADYDRTISSFGKDGMKTVLKKLGAELGEALANPLHAGIHPDFPASVNEETWIQDAVSSLKAMGADKWMRTMVKVLRDFLGGRPKEVVPNKNDRCPCKSGKKYGKCCGSGVLDTDPEDCKLGRHQFGGWSAGNGGKFIRGCEKCLKIDEAPYGEEVLLGNGTKVILIGCRTCTKAPEPEDARKAIVELNSKYKCAICGNPFKVEKAVCSHHVDNDGTHITEWKLTGVESSPKAIKYAYTVQNGDDGVGIAHQDCWEATFRHVSEKDGLVITTKKKDSKS